ncbi:MAG: DEAD/DEAH box helicase [Verrucomicrobiota bacterium]|nr:DEAD/DEAH box helicase [Verrucomicrobiota bacterium]
MNSSTVTFESLGLIEPLQRALKDRKYINASPIQAQAIPLLLEGRDVMGCAQTGTGKTAAFALPILQHLVNRPKTRNPRRPRALILTPTRELAVQIDESFGAYGAHLHMRHTVIYGGVGQHPQVRGLTQGTDIVIATPGRLLDLEQQGHVRFSEVEFFVLDEADRMLDMGFAPDVKRIIAKIPLNRQSLLFSATMPNAIIDIANSLLRNPVRIDITPETPTAERIEQRICHVARENKINLLHHVLNQHPEGLVLLFARTKHGADKVVKMLARDGVRSEAIHGNKSQNARQRALEGFRNGRVRILVATDIAARGIDVKGIELVINYDLPDEPESYVHRIGRTARAGKSGLAYSFCDHEERSTLRVIQKIIRMAIPVVADHPFALPAPDDRSAAPAAHRPAPRGGRGGRFSGRGSSGGGDAPRGHRPRSLHTR